MNIMTIQTSQLEAIVQRALDLKIATAISLYVACGKENIMLDRGKASENSLYDLASLTKILGTTIALAFGIARQKISLHEKPFLCWPEVTVVSLMNHTSGLTAHVKFYQNPAISTKDFDANKKIIFDQLFLQKPKRPAGKAREYSDLNFLALHYLLESRFKKTLGEIFHDAWRYFGLSPLHYSHSGYRPLMDAIPTSQEREGYVHDDNCYFLGGIAAHAGLFGTVKEVANYADFFRHVVKAPGNAGEDVLKYFIEHHLGFDAPTPRGSVRALSHQAFGHFGFTGTSLWTDPVRDLSIVVLTNRVFCSLNSTGIFWLRERIHNAAAMNNG